MKAKFYENAFLWARSMEAFFSQSVRKHENSNIKGGLLGKVIERKYNDAIDTTKYSEKMALNLI